MHKITTVAEMQQHAQLLRGAGRRIALVVTGGALHEGHQALLLAAHRYADALVVSVFANPLQFGPSEGFASYPRWPEEDLAVCEAARAEAVFLPEVAEMYPRGFSTTVHEEAMSRTLCGPSRPNHFKGVATLVSKLLNIVKPDVLLMGQKDAQQVAVVRKMIADLHFVCEVVVVPTVRASDGLAIGVRTRELTATQRSDAGAIFRALECAQKMVSSGVRSPDRVVAEATHILGQHRRLRVIYVTLVNRFTMEPVREIVPGECLLAIAVWVDEIRLVDNIEL